MHEALWAYHLLEDPEGNWQCHDLQHWLQDDMYNCGVWAIWYAEKWLQFMMPDRPSADLQLSFLQWLQPHLDSPPDVALLRQQSFLSLHLAKSAALQMPAVDRCQVLQQVPACGDAQPQPKRKPKRKAKAASVSDPQPQPMSQPPADSPQLDHSSHLTDAIFKEFATGPNDTCSSCRKACYPDQGTRPQACKPVSMHHAVAQCAAV